MMKSLLYENQLENTKIKKETLKLVRTKTDILTETIIIERTVGKCNIMKYPGLGGELIP